MPFCSTKAEKAAIRKALFEADIWISADRGLVNNSELFDIVKDELPAEYWSALKNCCEQWDICMKPIDGAKAFCEYVKCKGLNIYVLSNANDKFYDYFERLLPLSFFDGIVVSSDIHLIKPDSRCFGYLLDSYGLNAEDCLFIDDSPPNVAAAKELGMQAHLFRNDFERIKELYLM